MSFPTTAILDDCQRANESPLSQKGAWVTPFERAGLDLSANLTNHKIVKGGSGLSTFSAYRLVPEGPNCEVFATIVCPTSIQVGKFYSFPLYARWDLATQSGYYVQFVAGSGAISRVYRVVSGVTTNLTASTNPAGYFGSVVNGNTIGFRVLNDTIEPFIDSVSQGVWTDAAPLDVAGKIGFAATADSAIALSLFGGGSSSPGHGPLGGTTYARAGRAARDNAARGVSVGARSYAKAGASVRDEIAGGGRYTVRTYFKAGASVCNPVARGAPQFQPAPDAFADPYIVLLIHADGVDGSTTFTDVSAHPHAVTAVGGAQVDTLAPSIPFGQSALFDGSGSYISIPDSADFAFGSGDFTLDFWVRFGATAGSHDVICKRTGDGFGPFVLYQSGTNLSLYLSGSGSSWDVISGLLIGTVSTGTWYHVAVVRSGGVVTTYLNGSSVQSASIGAAVLYANALPLHLGGDGPTTWFNGWLDEIRISKGVARWTSNFTPPAAPYTGIINMEVSYDDVLTLGVG